MSDAPESVGDLTEKWWETKKIFEWTFKTPIPIAGPLLEKLGPPVASISMVNKDKRIVFVAHSSWFGGRRRHHDAIEATTIEELRTLVTRSFNDRLIAHAQVKWSDWIEIEVEEKDVLIEADCGRGMIKVEYKILKRAKFPDGRDMVLDGESLHPFPKGKAAGAEKRDSDHWSREYHQNTESQYAYIAATPENVEAVKALLARIGAVHDRLQSLLAQKSIGEALQLMGNGMLRLEQK